MTAWIVVGVICLVAAWGVLRLGSVLWALLRLIAGLAVGLFVVYQVMVNWSSISSALKVVGRIWEFVRSWVG